VYWPVQTSHTHDTLPSEAAQAGVSTGFPFQGVSAMIGSASNYTRYTSTTSSTTNTARSQQFQKGLLAKLDTNGDGAVDQDELKSALSQPENQQHRRNAARSRLPLTGDL
jgi:hypothetical protein